jgi:hypothetical protein
MGTTNLITPSFSSLTTVVRPRTLTIKPGVEFFRRGETHPLSAMRPFSFSDLQLLSPAGVVDAAEKGG